MHDAQVTKNVWALFVRGPNTLLELFSAMSRSVVAGAAAIYM
jgi:hypothetical protein